MACDKGYIWNPSNCACECDKLCDIGQYLDYKNCICRKSLIDKLVEECMLEYDRTDISEGIDINKSSDKSKECHICHYWYFLDKNFRYEPHLCNGCHDLMQKAMSFNDVAIVSIKD